MWLEPGWDRQRQRKAKHSTASVTCFYWIVLQWMSDDKMFSHSLMLFCTALIHKASASSQHMTKSLHLWEDQPDTLSLQLPREWRMRVLLSAAEQFLKVHLCYLYLFTCAWWACVLWWMGVVSFGVAGYREANWNFMWLAVVYPWLPGLVNSALSLSLSLSPSSFFVTFI